MTKNLIIITILNLLIVGFLVYKINPDPSVSIVLIIYIPLLIIINVIAGGILIVFKNKWATAFFINSIISPVIFYFLFNFAVQRQVDNNYKSYYFKYDNKKYEIIFDLEKGQFKNMSSYDFFERGNGSSWTIGLSGHYNSIGDTLMLLSDSGRVMKVIKTFLFDYPKNGDKIVMKTSLE